MIDPTMILQAGVGGGITAGTVYLILRLILIPKVNALCAAVNNVRTAMTMMLGVLVPKYPELDEVIHLLRDDGARI